MAENTLIPNTYQKPNVYSDVYDYYLTPPESKVLDFFVRRILGFEEHRETRRDRVSLSQICDGIQDKDGKWITFGTGMSRPEVVESIEALVKFGFIIRVGEPTRSGQEYQLILDDSKIDLDGLKARKEAAREAGRKRTRKARAIKNADDVAVSQTNQRLDCLTDNREISGKSVLPAVSQSDTQNKESYISDSLDAPAEDDILVCLRSHGLQGQPLENVHYKAMMDGITPAQVDALVSAAAADFAARRVEFSAAAFLGLYPYRAGWTYQPPRPRKPAPAPPATPTPEQVTHEEVVTRRPYAVLPDVTPCPIPAAERKQMYLDAKKRRRDAIHSPTA